MEHSKDIKIGYFRVKTGTRSGYVCVALARPPKGSGSKHYKAGISFCSPKEIFSKKLAREIAVGRLVNFSRTNKTGRVEFDSSLSQDCGLPELFFEALNAAIESDSVSDKNDKSRATPHWVSKVTSQVKFGLNDNV